MGKNKLNEINAHQMRLLLLAMAIDRTGRTVIRARSDRDTDELNALCEYGYVTKSDYTHLGGDVFYSPTKEGADAVFGMASSFVISGNNSATANDVRSERLVQARCERGLFNHEMDYAMWIRAGNDWQHKVTGRIISDGIAWNCFVATGKTPVIIIRGRSYEQ